MGSKERGEASPVEVERISPRGKGRLRESGGYVLYWMQKAQRARQNPALEHAAALSAASGRPLVVLFVLADFPGAASSHYRFMLEGLEETAAAIEDRGAAFLLRKGDAPDEVARLAAEAVALVGDGGRVRTEVAWRRRLEALLGRLEDPPLYLEVETEAVVPPAVASPKDEWSAATFRRKVEGAIPHYLRLLPEVEPAALRRGARSGRADLGLEGLGRPFSNHLSQLGRLPRDHRAKGRRAGDSLGTGTVSATLPRRLADQDHLPPSGTRAGLNRYETFLGQALDRYEADSNDPSAAASSGMSPYLHFGQVSPVDLALRASARGGPGVGPYLEQLIVRRELAANFTLRCPAYDEYESLPTWARAALESAAGDPRPVVYTREEFEAGATHDRYWNAAQEELVRTGTIHNYLRMYWGKKILEWSASPREAFATALFLNDAYALDGRDPNGYAGVAWCFGKHDRPWGGRAIYGTVRCMMASGLERKFDLGPYLARLEALGPPGA